MPEYKSIKAVGTMGIEDRTVTGVFCVHGNVDDGDGWTSSGDRSHPGLFGDFTVDGRKRAVFLWQHRMGDPPIATIDKLFEVSKADLPAPVRLYAPDATGGVAVTRTYLETPRGNEVLAGLKAGALSEMSYAYDPKRWDLEKQDAETYLPPIRNLYEADLIDVSDVNLGMNPATSADGTKDRPVGAHGDVVKAAVAGYITRIQDLAERRKKEGRVFSAANYAALKSLADDLEISIGTLRNLLAATEPKQAGNYAEDRALYLAWQQRRQAIAQLGVRTS